MIGNDIVDLHFADQPPYEHVGHPERVCTTEELLYIREAENPSLTLAALWATKEATYKLFSREAGFSFIPKQFVVRLKRATRLAASETAVASYRGIPTRVELSLTDEWVHAISIPQSAQIVRWKVREIDAASPGSLQPRQESEAVRSLALDLTSKYCQGDILPSFQGRIPILTNEAGSHSGIEISFSHHGKFAAVAVAWPIGQPGRFSTDTEFAGKVTPGEETCSTFTA